MQLPSFCVALRGNETITLYSGQDAGEATKIYEANTDKPGFDLVLLYVRPGFERRHRCKDQAATVAAAQPKKERVRNERS